MIIIPNWAKLKIIIDGFVTDADPFTRVCTGDTSHYMLYVARDGLTMSYRLNKAITNEQTADTGLTEFENDYKSNFL